MCWVPYEEDQKQRYLLLSLGNDGKVLLWKWTAAELQLVNGFRLLTESIPRSLRISKAKGDDPMGGEYGEVCDVVSKWELILKLKINK